MTPWSLHQAVPRLWIVLLNSLVDFQRAGQVLSIEPATYRKDCRSDVRQVLRNILRFPVPIVVSVLHPLVPETALAFEVLCICIRERTHIEKEPVAILSARIERHSLRHARASPLPAEIRAHQKEESMRKIEGPSMMNVVAEIVVVHRRLRRCRLECRMRID